MTREQQLKHGEVEGVLVEGTFQKGGGGIDYAYLEDEKNWEKIELESISDDDVPNCKLSQISSSLK